MTLDPHMKALADVLVGICVRELMMARSGNEKARDLVDEVHGLKTLEPNDDNRKIEATHTLQKLR